MSRCEQSILRIIMARSRARYSRGYVTLTAANNWQAHWFPYVKDAEGKEYRTHKTANAEV
jgi:hypothetical protein